MRIALFLFLVFDLHAFEIACPWGCGEIILDPDLETIGKIFAECLEKVELLKDQEVPAGYTYPSNCIKEPSLIDGYYRKYKKIGTVYWDYGYTWDDDEDSYPSYTFTHYREDYLNNTSSYAVYDYEFESYPKCLKIFSEVEKDLKLLYQAKTSHYFQRIEDLKEEITLIKTRLYDLAEPFLGIPDSRLKENFLDEMQEYKNDIEELQLQFPKHLSSLYEYQGKIESVYLKIYNWCIKNHDWEGSLYQRGLLYFMRGSLNESLSDIRSLVEQKMKDDSISELSSQIFLLKGQLLSEMGLYHEAISALSEALLKNPEYSDAYFEKATTYFELGHFDQALDDYIKSGFTSTEDESYFSLGLTKGLFHGGCDGLNDFIPSILASLHGLGHGLWAFVENPPKASKEFVQACSNLLEFLRETSTIESLKVLVPELRELIDSWNNFSQKKRGEIMGYIIGKYGIDIFMTAGCVKAVQAYRDLKKANALCTFEISTKSAANKQKILLEAQKRWSDREKALKHSLLIEGDKQGKHLLGHKNYVPKRNRSILVHKDPQKLVYDHAGTGIKEGNKIPGAAGYQEIVNFEEFIGYDVHPLTREKTATTWGKIHYSEKGVHVVPTQPRN